MWGLDRAGYFKVGKSDVQSSDQWMEAAKDRVYQTLVRSSINVEAAVLADIKRVRNETTVELRRMQGRADMERRRGRGDKEEEKRLIGKRLLYLFQKDLLPGVSGQILEAKSDRDNKVILETTTILHH
jgi:hypothetical protein